MSDSSSTIVPIIADYPNRKQKAQEILDWLFSIDGIKPIKTDCILSSDFGYPIGDGAKALTNEPEYLPYGYYVNGLDLITERTVFHSGEGGIDGFICPGCREDIQSEALEFLSEFYATGNSTLTCPKCQLNYDLNEYEVDPVWGFSNLGFTFWGWPGFSDDFIADFENKLGCNVRVVFCHI